MKRTPLKREKPLRRGEPLKSRGFLKRSRMAQGDAEIPKVSRKRAKENQERTRVLKALREKVKVCQARCVRECTGATDDGHEILTRARGGSITDPNNIVLLCRPCHSYLTEHPIEAERLGLMRRG